MGLGATGGPFFTLSFSSAFSTLEPTNSDSDFFRTVSELLRFCFSLFLSMPGCKSKWTLFSLMVGLNKLFMQSEILTQGSSVVSRL